MNVTSTQNITELDVLTIDEMVKIIDEMPDKPKYNAIKLSKKHYKQLEKEFKEKPYLSGFKNIHQGLMGFQVIITPRLKKPRLVNLP